MNIISDSRHFEILPILGCPPLTAAALSYTASHNYVCGSHYSVKEVCLLSGTCIYTCISGSVLGRYVLCIGSLL